MGAIWAVFDTLLEKQSRSDLISDSPGVTSYLGQASCGYANTCREAKLFFSI